MKFQGLKTLLDQNLVSTYVLYLFTDFSFKLKKNLSKNLNDSSISSLELNRSG